MLRMTSPVGRMLGVVNKLAADEFTGRRTGTPGGKAAATWLACHLESLGATVTLDEFGVTAAVKELKATPVLRWRDELGEWSQSLVHRKDFAEHLATAYTPELVSGKLALAGQTELAGAWVLAETFAAQHIQQLAERGAVGALLPRGTDEAGWMPKMIAGPPASVLPVLSVRTDLHRRMAAAASGRSAAVTASVPLSTVDVKGTNVYAVFRPPHAENVLLTAHFDGVGDGPGGVRFPAAADNASGVAVVLEAARQLNQTLPADAGLAVALLDAEEAGAHGSAHHAPKVRPGTSVINLDGAAQLHQAAAVEAGGAAMRLLQALDRAGKEAGIPLRPRAMPSDNRRYAAAGLAAIGIGMGIAGYQTPAETPDRVEPRTLRAACRLIVLTVEQLATLPVVSSIA
jgi:aminopeptidase YwaD